MRIRFNPLSHEQECDRLLEHHDQEYDRIYSELDRQFQTLHNRWITQQPGADLRSWILTNLHYRDTKTCAYRIATLLLLLSMVGYLIAVVIAVMRL
jgi:hypothetical protein